MTKRIAAIIFVLFITCLLFFSGCTQISAPPETDILGRNYIDLLHKADFETAIHFHTTNIANIDISKIDEITKPIQEEPFSAELIQSNKELTNANRYDLFYDINANNKYFLLTLITENTSGENRIAGFHLKPLDKSAKELSTFTLSNKPPVQYIIFTLAIIIPIFILATLIICIKTPIKKHKWLWIIFILLGIGTIKLNWTTSEVGFQPIAFLLFGVGGFRGIIPTDPWIISISLPLGAIIFLFMKNKIKHNTIKRSIIPTK